MSTAREVISGGLRLLSIRPAESPITDAEVADGVESLNDMLNEWKADGIDIDWETVTDADERLYVDESVIGPIKSNFAIYVAPEYSAEVPPWLAMRADEGKKTVRAAKLNLESLSFPDTLPVGSGNEWNNYVPDGDSPGNVVPTRFYPKNLPRKCS